ncbi:orotidine-5'-phosphate decarboxylase [Thorsellia kenyensis]|uniref:Orotidine 5'-phosphate decarboxylase n=1 Tax=Thorsellia kenyensis TaxID=1549888 RepID=A0ABV6CAX1_9GAMM
MTDIIIALDYENDTDALALVDKIDPNMAKLKVGKEMFTRYGPSLVQQLHSREFKVFLDLKFHDIPNTVAKAIKASADLGVWMVNVHSSGGEKMMTAAKEALHAYGKDAPLLIGVTVLTSLQQEDLTLVGITNRLLDHTLSLAELAQKVGLDGVVCSAQEAQNIKNKLGQNFRLVTPGIRLSMDNSDDQKRVVTPLKAKELGVDHMVIGRPITQSDNPISVLEEIYHSINN